MTNQEAFDIMVEHLGNLKGRSVNSSGNCVYNGSKCVVGILMTDEEQEKYGGYQGDVRYLLRQMSLAGHTSHLHQLNRSILQAMQDLHDLPRPGWNGDDFVAWGKVQEIADEFNLEYKGPKA